MEFFRFYAVEFDYENWVVSVRTGRILSKTEKGWNIGRKTVYKYNPNMHNVNPSALNSNSMHLADHLNIINRDNFLFCVEDPFETTHNLGRVADKDSLKVIQFEFRRAYRLCMQRGTTDLQQLCSPYLEA